MRMIIILGMLIGLAYGFFRGQNTSKKRSDIIFSGLSYALVGFTAGVILTLFIQLFANSLG